MFAVMVEFAKRVAERSPPLNSTSASPALAAMFNTLSVIAFTSSREYITGQATTGSTGQTIPGLLYGHPVCEYPDHDEETWRAAQQGWGEIAGKETRQQPTRLRSASGRQQDAWCLRQGGAAARRRVGRLGQGHRRRPDLVT